MSARRKLTSTFGSLAAIALLVVAVTLWTSGEREASDERLRNHYDRSLLVQRVRSTTFRAFKEVPDALDARERDARAEIEARLPPAERDVRAWAALEDSDAERREVATVRDAFRRLVADARRTLVTAERGDLALAERLVDEPLDAELERFERLTNRAVAADRRRRAEVRAAADRQSATSRLVLLVAALGTVSAALLVAAYLASDLFGPLRRLEQGLDALAHGDLDHRLEEGRRDELGAVQRAFNRMVDAVAAREAVGRLEAATGRSGPVTSRATLHRLVTELRARVGALDGEDGPVRAELDRLAQAVTRITELSFPLDLALARTDVRALLYDVAARFQDALAARGTSLEIDLAPEVGHALADRRKLREVLVELVRNALDALPVDGGGRLGLRATRQDGELVLEVADDGPGIPAPLVDAIWARPDADTFGLPSAREVVEQHGGRLTIDTKAGVGTLVRVALPAID